MEYQQFVARFSSSVAEELNITTTCTLAGIEDPLIPVHKFSSFNLYKRVTAWTIRFIHNCKSRVQATQPKSGSHTAIRTTLLIVPHEAYFPLSFSTMTFGGVDHHGSSCCHLNGPGTIHRLMSEKPCNWVWYSPTIVKAKILLQALWLEGIGWDDCVPNAILEEWSKWR